MFCLSDSNIHNFILSYYYFKLQDDEDFLRSKAKVEKWAKWIRLVNGDLGQSPIERSYFLKVKKWQIHRFPLSVWWTSIEADLIWTFWPAYLLFSVLRYNRPHFKFTLNLLLILSLRSILKTLLTLVWVQRQKGIRSKKGTGMKAVRSSRDRHVCVQGCYLVQPYTV